VLWILGVGWTHRSVVDDGFIYLRIVRQIEAGNGPVFNAGERVETYTGVLWLGILTVADVVTPFTLEWLAVALGLTLTATGVALAMLGSRRLWAPTIPTDDAPRSSGHRWFVPLGMIVFVAVYPTWVFASSGLETGLVFAWLGGCLWVLARWSSDSNRRLSIPELVLVGIGWLVRPELVLLSAVFLVIVLAASWVVDDWRSRSRIIVAATALPVIYQVFRMGYFGSIVANTATAKDGTSTNWERGRRYFFDFVEPYQLWIPVLGLVLAGLVPLVTFLVRSRFTRRSAVVGAFIGCGMVLALYVVAVGGDYLHARLFLPALMAVCSPLAVVPATRSHMLGLVVAGWAAVAALSLRPDQLAPDGFLANGFVLVDQSELVTLADFDWNDTGSRRAWFTGPGLFVQDGFIDFPKKDLAVRDGLPESVVVMWAIGVSGYALDTDVYIYDMLGLGDVVTSHFEVANAGLAGHEKPSPPAWSAARLTPPDSWVEPASFPAVVNPLDPNPDRTFEEQVAWARAALECDRIVDLIESADAPLTLGRFMKNLVGSPGRARLRIPADPETAYRRFCGDGTPPEVEQARAAPAEN
jgi:arabinofuranosyltransferase